MKVKRFENVDNLVNRTVEEVKRILSEKPDAVFCFACGETPRPVMGKLIKMNREGEIDFSRARFVGLDEWIGVGRQTIGSCKQMLYDDFFTPLGLREDQITLFNGLSNDLQAEIRKINSLISDLGIDFILLGVGMNGHIGLNEPGCDTALEAHIVDLSEMTIKVMTKYFNKEMNLTKGISLGFAQLLRAKNIYLIATGKRKAIIVEKIINSSPTNVLPATLLKDSLYESNFYVDLEAGFFI